MNEVLGFIHTRGAWSLLGLIVIVAIIAIVLPCLGGCSGKDDSK